MHFIHEYFDLTNHIIPGPQSLSYFVPLLALVTALLIPRTTLSRWSSKAIFMPIIVTATAHAWWTMRGVDVISVDIVLWSFLFLVLNDPWKDFAYLKVDEQTINNAMPKPTRETDSDSRARDSETDSLIAGTERSTQVSNAVSKITYPAFFFPRFQWVMILLSSIRLNNWYINKPSHDKTQPPAPGFRNRKTFILRTLLNTLRGYLILDLTSAYVSNDPYFTDPGIPITSPLPIRGLQSFPSQVIRSMIIGLQAWALISQLFYLPCVLPVTMNALNLLPSAWSPHTWPAYFGFSTVIFKHGVRGFWGGYWHQMMRHMCSAPGYALADALGVQSHGSLGRYVVITVVAFGLSGITHMGLVPPEPLRATVDVAVVRLCVAGFFWMQPVAMLVETLAAKGCLWSGLRVPMGVRMAVNAVWVVSWFSLCLPLLGEAGRQLGYWRFWLVPFSVWRAVRGEDAVTWPILQD